MLPPLAPPVADKGHAMTTVRVIHEEDTAQGWSHQVEIKPDQGQTALVLVQLSFQDYEYWSGGARPPEQVTASLVECLLDPGEDASVPTPLPEQFDASTGPTGALAVQRPEMKVIFDQKKCSICELCVPACPPRAMEVLPTHQSFFE